MCTLNQLKKKLHLNKLIQFLNQYPYIVFYHSNKGNALRYDLIKANASLAVLFLVNSARIRDLTKANKVSAGGYPKHNKDHTVTSPIVAKKDSGILSQDILWQKTLLEMKAETLSGLPTQSKSGRSLQGNNSRYMRCLAPLAEGGAMGSTFLVGCNSLEALQLVIRDNWPAKNQKNADVVCLGAIYSHSFKDHLDCLRLSEMNSSIKVAQEKLVHTLSSVQNRLLSELSRAQNHMHLCLMAASRSER